MPTEKHFSCTDLMGCPAYWNGHSIVVCVEVNTPGIYERVKNCMGDVEKGKVVSFDEDGGITIRIESRFPVTMPSYNIDAPRGAYIIVYY